MKLLHGPAFVIYRLFAKFLPPSYGPLGQFWKMIRGALAAQCLDRCGRNVNVEQGAEFGNGAGVELGDNSGIGRNARVYGAVRIGRDVLMGPRVMVIGRDHNYEDASRLIREQGARISPIVIEDDVFIGARAIILGGSVIRKGAVIGAGAVVRGEIPPYAVAVGNPAKVIKYRVKESAQAPSPRP